MLQAVSAIGTKNEMLGGLYGSLMRQRSRLLELNARRQPVLLGGKHHPTATGVLRDDLRKAVDMPRGSSHGLLRVHLSTYKLTLRVRGFFKRKKEKTNPYTHPHAHTPQG